MSWTSPLTVARTILPRAAVSAFSMNCSRWLTPVFMASADWSTSATISSLLLNRRPTSAHAGHEGAVDDVEGRHAFGAFAVEVLDESVLGALDDVVGEALIEGEVGGLGLGFGRRLCGSDR
jgi:hypothetical protein